MHSVIESTKSWKETSPKPPSSVATFSITYTLICFKELLKYLMLVVEVLCPSSVATFFVSEILLCFKEFIKYLMLVVEVSYLGSVATLCLTINLRIIEFPQVTNTAGSGIVALLLFS